ncbi:MAG: L-lysine 6-transaminase [Candidatus Heimdallarchaeota archaeon]|nr:L-lysine 6-transaminase [Candidatus Heimdallarchaeota archaeon]MCK5143491.1 L-lysine 6-transaminase [Candidatus Heimdallarchaeota archaeon]
MDAIEKIGKHMLVDGYPLVLDLKKSHGCRLVDKKNDKTFLDFFSFFASSPVGMNHPAMMEKEFLNQLAEVAVNKPSCSDIYTDEMGDFVETFSRVGIPNDMPNLFLISGGALAVENGLKTAFDWKVRKNLSKGFEDEVGSQVIHFEQSFHGRTGYTLSLTNTFDPKKTKYFPKFPWPRVSNPKVTFPIEDNFEQIVIAEEKSCQEIHDAIEKYGDDIACILIEPIQAEGGDNHFRPQFFQKLRQMADNHDILLIYDEIQTGVGMTGKFWAYEHFGDAKPDILCFGKKMQVCGILASDKVKEVENNVFEESSRINSTWGGNLTDIFRVTKYLEIIEKENLVDNAAKMGEYMLKKVKELQADFPEKISNSRGRGLFTAFDLESAEMRDQIRKDSYAKELLILGCGEKTIRFRPYLNVTPEEIDECMSILRDVIKNL